MDRKDYKYIYNSLNKKGSERYFKYPIYINNKEVATQEWVSQMIEGDISVNYLTKSEAEETYLTQSDALNTYQPKGSYATTDYYWANVKISDKLAIDTSPTFKSINSTSDSAEHSIATGTNTSSYFQSRKFRGEGNASTYYHAIDFGYQNHDMVDFYEYGGIWNFWKNQSPTATTDTSNLCLKITQSSLQNKSYIYTWPNKTGTIAITSDIPTYLPNPHSLKFGENYYNGEDEMEIKASDLGALTQTDADDIYQPKGNYVTLNSSNQIDATYLPSYVDDVLEYSSINDFPTTNIETGKIYVDTSTNLTYRWSGSGYVEIGNSLALGETSSTAYAGDKGAANRTDINTLKTYFTSGIANRAIADKDGNNIINTYVPISIKNTDGNIIGIVNNNSSSTSLGRINWSDKKTHNLEFNQDGIKMYSEDNYGSDYVNKTEIDVNEKMFFASYENSSNNYFGGMGVGLQEDNDFPFAYISTSNGTNTGGIGVTPTDIYLLSTNRPLWNSKEIALVDEITSFTDTKNTAGATDTSDQIYLIGATSQASNPVTYSHDTAYVGTDGCLYSNNTKVSVEGHTHSQYLTLSGGTLTGIVRGGAIDPHPENGGTVIGYYTNDLANLLKRGGSCVATNTTQGTTISVSDNWFDASPSYGSFNVTATTDVVQIIIKSPTVYSWGTVGGIGFGSSSWRAKSVKMEMGYSATNTGSASSPDSDIVWVTRINITENANGLVYGNTSGPSTSEGGVAASSWSYIKLTLTNWNNTGPRIAQIYTINFGSSGMHNAFLSRSGGTVYGSITPYANSSYNLGGSSNKWANIYGTNIYQNGTKVSIEGHTHTKSQITDFPTSLKNPNSLSFGSKTYDGSSAVTLTASDLGALTTSDASSTYQPKGDYVDLTTSQSISGTKTFTNGVNVGDGSEYDTLYNTDYITRTIYDTVNGTDDVDYTYNFPDKSGTFALTSDIPTVGDGMLILQKNGTQQGTFKANATTNTTINITVPTNTSDLTNDSGYLTEHQDISGKANLSGGNTFSGNQIFTGYLDIRGTAAEKHLKTRGIGGSDGNGTEADLYLQYSSNYATKFGKSGTGSLNSDGTITEAGTLLSNKYAAKSHTHSEYVSNVEITSSSSGSVSVGGKAGTVPTDLGDGDVYTLSGTKNIGLGATNVTITPSGLTKSASGSYNSSTGDYSWTLYTTTSGGIVAAIIEWSGGDDEIKVTQNGTENIVGYFNKINGQSIVDITEPKDFDLLPTSIFTNFIEGPFDFVDNSGDLDEWSYFIGDELGFIKSKGFVTGVFSVGSSISLTDSGSYMWIVFPQSYSTNTFSFTADSTSATGYHFAIIQRDQTPGCIRYFSSTTTLARIAATSITFSTKMRYIKFTMDS